MTESVMPLCVFVYGSLKRGYRNHRTYCGEYEAFRPATVQGKLFRQADGYPMLTVPDSSVLALGSADLAADLRRFAEVKQAFAMQKANPTDTISKPPTDADSDEDWQPIQGEIYAWPAQAIVENQHRLSRLDQLEDFLPGQPDALYHRAIVLAQHTDGWEPVWVYIAPAGKLPQGVSPMGRSWP